MEFAAHELGLCARVIDTHVGGVARRHRHRHHALGAQRIDRQRQGQCRVDTARQAEHTAREAILGDVVADAEYQRVVDLGLVSAGQRMMRATQADALGSALKSQRQQVFDEGRRLGTQRTIGIEREGAAVEHQFVLATDGIHIGHRHAAGQGCRAYRRQTFRRLAQVIGRGVDIAHEFGAGGARLGGASRCPDVFADA